MESYKKTPETKINKEEIFVSDEVFQAPTSTENFSINVDEVKKEDQEDLEEVRKKLMATQATPRDAVQEKLGEMEAIAPSTKETANSVGIVGRIKSFFHFLNRKSEISNFESISWTNKINSDYEGFREFFDSPVPKEFRDYFERKFYPDGLPKRKDDREHFISRLETAAEEFYAKVDKMPQEDRNFIIEVLKSGDSEFSHYYPEHILNKTKRRLFILDSEGERQISVKGLIAVHKTNFIPHDKIIETTGSAVVSDEKYSSEETLPMEAIRQTVHFTLNAPVSSHEGGNWEDQNYAILLPLENFIQDNVITLSAADTFTLGNVGLENRGAELVISAEAFKKMSKDEIDGLKQKTGAEIITIQDSADKDLDETIIRRISERGYTTIKAGSNGSWDGQADLIKLAKSLKKDTSMHYWSSFGNIEDNVARIRADDVGNSSNSETRKNTEENIVNNFGEIKKHVRSVRGGKTTKQDKKNLAKIKIASRKIIK